MEDTNTTVGDDYDNVANAIEVNSTRKSMTVRILVHSARGLVTPDSERRKSFRKSLSDMFDSMRGKKQSSARPMSMNMSELQQQIQNFDLGTAYGELGSGFSQMDELSQNTDDATEFDLHSYIPVPEYPETPFDKLEQKPLSVSTFFVASSGKAKRRSRSGKGSNPIWNEVVFLPIENCFLENIKISIYSAQILRKKSIGYAMLNNLNTFERNVVTSHELHLVGKPGFISVSVLITDYDASLFKMLPITQKQLEKYEPSENILISLKHDEHLENTLKIKIGGTNDFLHETVHTLKPSHRAIIRHRIEGRTLLAITQTEKNPSCNIAVYLIHNHEKKLVGKCWLDFDSAQHRFRYVRYDKPDTFVIFGDYVSAHVMQNETKYCGEIRTEEGLKKWSNNSTKKHGISLRVSGDMEANSHLHFIAMALIYDRKVKDDEIRKLLQYQGGTGANFAAHAVGGFLLI